MNININYIIRMTNWQLNKFKKLTIIGNQDYQDIEIMEDGPTCFYYIINKKEVYKFYFYSNDKENCGIEYIINYKCDYNFLIKKRIYLNDIFIKLDKSHVITGIDNIDNEDNLNNDIIELIHFLLYKNSENDINLDCSEETKKLYFNAYYKKYKMIVVNKQLFIK